MGKELELYIHLPFCVKKCQYCDFLSGPYGENTKKCYLEALKKEMAAAAPQVEDCRITSVFFGGGTPSLLDGREMGGLLKTLHARYRLAEDCEITMEGNPGTFTRENLREYVRLGINRFSIGCQSVEDQKLRMLGRIHTFQDFLDSYDMAREAGISNINVDLMSALPGQSPADWEKNLRTIGSLHPEHISAYSLIVEEGTPFGEMDLELPEEEDERRMYEMTREILEEYGLYQYEISNYAVPGKECRHNIGYWRRSDYLGFGLGAASLFLGERFSNTREMKRYLDASGDLDCIREQRQRLTAKEQMEEFMFLGLRMTDGIGREAFARAFGVELEEIYGPVLDKYRTLGLLAEEEGRIFLTPQGINVSNVIFADFLLD
ncbi:MAG: radical SAM family heme chaperone HemW [Blautia sp.]